MGSQSERSSEPMKGSYVLLIRVEKAMQVNVGALGTVAFDPDFYAYVGSAMTGLRKRVQRHLGTKKKLFWHIDYLLEHAEVIEVLQVESPKKLECDLAMRLSKKLESVPRFGCSDCKCPSHLFYHGGLQAVKACVAAAGTPKHSG